MINVNSIRWQSLLKTFINAENLEAEIERALNSKKSFNFVIDKDGLIHKEQSDGKLAEETLEQQIKKLSMKEKAKDEEQSTTPWTPTLVLLFNKVFQS